MKIINREDAENQQVLNRLETCNCVLFSGGDQARLCSKLGGTSFILRLIQRYCNECFVVAGTSAGAASVSQTMICGGPEDRAYLKGEAQLNIGFGLLPNVIVDTHFDTRIRFGRLAQVVTKQPGELGIGLDENTGIIVE